jgi:hypothetical protein
MAWQRFRCQMDCTKDEHGRVNCVSEELFRSIAEAMVSEGFAAAGYMCSPLERPPRALNAIQIHQLTPGFSSSYDMKTIQFGAGTNSSRSIPAGRSASAVFAHQSFCCIFREMNMSVNFSIKLSKLFDETDAQGHVIANRTRFPCKLTSNSPAALGSPGLFREVACDDSRYAGAL